MDLTSKYLTRRKAIKSTVMLLGGSIAAVQLGPLIKCVDAIELDYKLKFLNQYQFDMIKRIADIIIPESDTPGALSANVHQFIDIMLHGWASPKTQDKFIQYFSNIDQRSKSNFGKNFSDLNRQQQFQLLKKLDKESFSDISSNVFFKEFKALIIFSYYSSEEGASIELKYDRIPGEYAECIPLDSVGRSWST